MTDKPENPRMFPLSYTVSHGGDLIAGEDGILLRDHFAGIALSSKTIGSPKDAADMAYDYADAMLKARME